MEAQYHGPSLWGLPDRLLHCGISIAFAARFMAEMGQKQRISVLLRPAFMSEVSPIPTEFCALQRDSSSPNSGNWHRDEVR